MVGRETSQICRIMRDDQAAAEPDSGSHHERIHSHFAPAPRPGEHVPRDPGDPYARRHHPDEPPTQHLIYRFVCSSPAIELDEDRRWHTHRLPTPLRRA